ncbi:unnamed protein product, partial [Didymodactylos carnosus]
LLAVIIGEKSTSAAFNAAALGIGAVAGGVGAAVYSAGEDIDVTEHQKVHQLLILDRYSKGFEKKLTNDNNNNSMINIVWYDKQIETRINQYHVEKLTTEFSTKNYPVIQVDSKDKLIQLIITDTDHNMILMTSGSAGQEVISETGSYWNIKEIIIFCGKVEQHQAWAWE